MKFLGASTRPDRPLACSRRPLCRDAFRPDAISSGRLPLDAPGKMYAANGVGRACAGCDDAIGPEEVEYEADYGEGSSYYLHLGCAAFWNTQVRRSPDAIIGD